MMFHTNEVQTIVITRGQSAPVLPESGLTFSSSGQGSFPLGSTYLSFGSSKLQIRSTMFAKSNCWFVQFNKLWSEGVEKRISWLFV